MLDTKRLKSMVESNENDYFILQSTKMVCHYELVPGDRIEMTEYYEEYSLDQFKITELI